MKFPCMRAPSASDLLLLLVFAGVLTLNFAFWSHARTVLSAWPNVPAPPSNLAAPLSGVGDEEAAYRLYGYSLQNFGNAGGRFMPLRDYDYAMLKKWFFMAQTLDPRANYVPFLAAFYFGAIEDRPEALSHIVDFLAVEGQAPYPQKWRWLAHAVYLARYKLNDMPRALSLAETLSKMKGDDVAPWARQLPAFIQLQIGNREAAYEIMSRMVLSEQGKVHPNELNEMVRFICTRALLPEDAAQNPLCVKPK